MRTYILQLAVACVFTAMSAARADSFNGLSYSTSETVRPGEWTARYAKAVSIASSKHVPLVAVWVNPGCYYCEQLEAALASSAVVNWMKDRGYAFVIGIGGRTSEADAVYNFAGTGAFPCCRVKWPKAGGKSVDSGAFTGRSGSMPSKGGSLAQQFMDSVDAVAGAYAGVSKSSGASADPAPAEPAAKPAAKAVSYTVTFDSNGGDAVPERTVKTGRTVGTLPKMVRPGYLFDGWYTAKTGGTKISSSRVVKADVVFYAHWTAGCTLTVVSADASRGSVSGSGTFKVGTKQKVKAAAKSGNVFAGWYLDRAFTKPAGAYLKSGEHRSTSDSFIVPDEREVSLFARFVAKAEDLPTIDVPAAWRVDTASSSDALAIAVRSLSLPKLTAKGLPAGIGLSGMALKVVNASKLKPGTKDVTLTVKNAAGKTASAKVSVRVPNLQAPDCIMVDTSDAGYTLYAGVEIGMALADIWTKSGWTLSVSGVPAGLKWNSSAGAFKTTSVPTKAGTYTMTFTAKKRGSATYKATSTVTVVPLPGWATGTFQGCGFDGASCAGPLTLTVSSKGAISGKYLAQGETWKLSAPAYESYDPVHSQYVAQVTGRCGKREIVDRIVVGQLEADDSRGGAHGELFRANQDVWKSGDWKTLAKSIDRASALVYEEQESVPVKVTLSFGASGKVMAKGVFTIGETSKGKPVTYSVSGSTALNIIDGVHFTVVVYFPPKAKKLDDGFVRALDLFWNGAQMELEK